jgi:hypothetical protein
MDRLVCSIIHYITFSCKSEVTCHKNAMKIQHANITQKMLDDYEEKFRSLRDDPLRVTTHSIIIIDQSGVM